MFREAYGPTHPEPALSPYLAEAFALASVERMLTDPDTAVLVIESDGDEAFVGYAHLHMAAPDATSTVLTEPLPGRRPIEIVRFYVAADYHGRGLALALMSACDAEARARGADVLWLQAWQKAGRALAFYEKAGLTRIGTTVFHFGDRVDHDFVMARPVRC
ncbi:MAG: GNAT family N-acetyltransferase [Gemmatimonadaceae bacterium]